MKKWERLYLEGKFKIDSFAPSKLVKGILKYQDKFDNVLDIRCGNGRNSVYLSKFSVKIDSIDKVDLDFLKQSPKSAKDKIRFYKKDIEKFNFEKKEYDLILMIRIIQYIPKYKLKKIFHNLSKVLKKNGLIIISYTQSGGIFSQNLNIKKYKHSIEFLKKLFSENGLKTKMIRKGCENTTHVPYKCKVKTYELILIKK
ncbi:MAG: class I SAM-dependent methyltransferase [Candidatus Pacearchaeota archaeon]|jgi:predicted TPR repeat methyltransferase